MTNWALVTTLHTEDAASQRCRFMLYYSYKKITMDAAENQIVVYQPNETVRLDVRLECCHCENVASGQFQFPIEEAA